MYYFFIFFWFPYYGTSYRRSCHRNFKKDSFDWKLEGLVLFLIAESDWKAANTLPRPEFPQTHPPKFWDSHFVQRSWKFWKLGLWGGKPPTVLRARVVSYVLGAYKVFIESVVVETSKKSSFDWKFKGLVPFLKVKSDSRATNPTTDLTPTFSPNTPNQNF